jgi:hypothetical protein
MKHPEIELRGIRKTRNADGTPLRWLFEVWYEGDWRMEFCCNSSAPANIKMKDLISHYKNEHGEIPCRNK